VRIYIELELEATHHEFDNGTVRLETLTFPGCTQNLLPFMSVSEQDAAQQAVEDEVEKATTDKLEKLRELKEMRCDIAREFRDEALAELQQQRGVRI
jgi:hypothetical protein